MKRLLLIGIVSMGFLSLQTTVRGSEDMSCSEQADECERQGGSFELCHTGWYACMCARYGGSFYCDRQVLD